MNVHISSVYPPKLGGLERVVQVLANTQKRMGKEVAVITSNQGVVNNNIQKEVYEVSRLKSFVVANTTIMPNLLFKLLRLKRTDTAHVHIVQAYMPEIVWLASKIKHFSYIAHIHLDVPSSGPAGFLLRPYKSLVLKRVLRAAKFVIVFTEEQKAEINRRYGVDAAHIKVVPNGVEDRFYNDKKRTIHKKPRLLFVGRLGYQKNLQQLLHALDGISDQFETTLVGDGEQEAELKKLTKNLGLKNVSFAGRKDGDELLNYYKEADIFVLSSEREGMPLVLLEAMAMGLPVVATNVTGNRDVIDDGKNGLLVEYNDEAAFRKALLKFKSDPSLYKSMSLTAHKMAEQYSWDKIAAHFDKLYREKPNSNLKNVSSHNKAKSSLPKKPIALWRLILPFLILANLAYLSKDIFGWIITLGFFLLIPGYLLLGSLKHGIKSRLEIASFSLGLSLLVLMVSGLALNSLHSFGLTQPLTTPNIFTVLDLVTISLLALNKNKLVTLPLMQLRASAEQVLISSILTLLPLLAIGGAIRLNNGASNILTLILFAAIPVLFVYLIARKSLRPLYPYAIFVFGLSVLFSTSLRGWSIAGHDIHREFDVFQAVVQKGYWSATTPNGNPYNACLSITILPTIIAKITSISAPYIYKAVFQVVFAFGVLSIYQFIKLMSNDDSKAFVGSFVFILFPTFINDMPFLNRQEIAFVFFALLLLTTFLELARKQKLILTFLIMFGMILSHYSSSYVAIGLFLLAWLFHKVLSRKREVSDELLPLLSLPIIFTALLFTFLWNAQITASTSNFKKAISGTVSGLVGGSSNRDSFVQYSLFAPALPQTPEQKFTEYVSTRNDSAQYATPTQIPITPIGTAASRVINVSLFNNFMHSMVAKILQILVLLGIVIQFLNWKRAKTKRKDIYLYSLALACVSALILFTVLPQLSVDYNVTRLFQQTLVILWLPILISSSFLLGFLGRFKLYGISLLFALIFLDVSGFVPQITGGFLPQMSLNNSGVYYDFFYTHQSDIVASHWLAENRNKTKVIHVDSTADAPPLNYPVYTGFILNDSKGYLYQDNVNVSRGVYRIIISGEFVEYTDPAATSKSNLLYSNQGSKVYYR